MRDYEQGKNSLVVAQFTRLLYSKKRGARDYEFVVAHIARFIFKEKRCYELRDYEQGKDSLVVAQFIRTRKGLACIAQFKEKRCYELRDYEQGKNSLVVAQFTRLLYSKKRGAMNCATTNKERTRL